MKPIFISYESFRNYAISLESDFCLSSTLMQKSSSKITELISFNFTLQRKKISKFCTPLIVLQRNNNDYFIRQKILIITHQRHDYIATSNRFDIKAFRLLPYHHDREKRIKRTKIWYNPYENEGDAVIVPR